MLFLYIILSLYHHFPFLEWWLPSIYTLYMNKESMNEKLSFINFNKFSLQRTSHKPLIPFPSFHHYFSPSHSWSQQLWASHRKLPPQSPGVSNYWWPPHAGKSSSPQPQPADVTKKVADVIDDNTYRMVFLDATRTGWMTRKPL